MAALTFTDLATVPSGVSATVTGSGGASNSIYVCQNTGIISPTYPPAWSLGATLVGDGSTTIFLAAGFWFGYCSSAPATLSAIVYSQVTTGQLSVLDQLMVSAKATLNLLNLPTFAGGVISSAAIFDVLNDKDPNNTLPCILMTTDKGRKSNEASLNGRDDLGYPIKLLIKDTCIKWDNSRRSLYRGWEQAIYRAFNNQRMPGISPGGTSIVNRVEVGDVTPVSQEAPQVVCDITVRAICREPRGVGA